MNKQKKKEIGDLYAIPLPSNKYGFGKIFRDASIGIYKHIGIYRTDLPTKEEFQFVVGVYDDVLKSKDWIFVENRPFKKEEEEWPPPMYVVDEISGQYSIYHKGEFRKTTAKDCEGLELAAVWEAEHIIDRIMGSEKWSNI